jgi:hypothetical protein
MIASLLDDHASELWTAANDPTDPMSLARIVMVANALGNLANAMRDPVPEPVRQEMFASDPLDCPTCAA